MKPIQLKIIGFLALILSLQACSSTPQDQNQTQASSSPTPSPSDSGHMMSGMEHSMAMDLGPADVNYDLRFIDAMTLHHKGAVVMAQSALNKSTHPQIKQLANDIIKAQNKEINEMQQWRKAWYPQASTEPVTYGGEKGKPMMPMSAQQHQSMMMSKDLGPADAQFDLNFIDAMIPHHEGAVTMAKDALSKAKHPQIKQLSKDIVISQQKEIEQMQQWRKAWYKQ